MAIFLPTPQFSGAWDQGHLALEGYKLREGVKQL